jgi:lipopolysaccharide export system protein LptC
MVLLLAFILIGERKTISMNNADTITSAEKARATSYAKQGISMVPFVLAQRVTFFLKKTTPQFTFPITIMI